MTVKAFKDLTDGVQPAIEVLPTTSGYTATSAADLRSAQVILWGKAGGWAHDTFCELNAAYFENAIPHAGIVWGLTPHGHHLGHTFSDGRITLHPALLDPQSDAWNIAHLLGDRYARDVLLHEMIPAFLFAQREVSAHNAAPWCREVERLAVGLGLGIVHAAPVKARRIYGRVVKAPQDGYLTQNALARFPHSLRDNAYYHGSKGRIRIRI